MKPSVIDLFAGVGGLSLGFEKQDLKFSLQMNTINQLQLHTSRIIRIQK